MDDTRASITVNGDQGNDFFQIGQLFRSRRTPALAGVAPEDVFATIETTQGWLSNGISKPMTINGGVGNDNFIVFHNLDTLSLFGDAGNDNFLVQAFALAGSQEDHRALTDLSGGGGADLIQYEQDAERCQATAARRLPLDGVRRDLRAAASRCGTRSRT